MHLGLRFVEEAEERFVLRDRALGWMTFSLGIAAAGLFFALQAWQDEDSDTMMIGLLVTVVFAGFASLTQWTDAEFDRTTDEIRIQRRGLWKSSCDTYRFSALERVGTETVRGSKTTTFRVQLQFSGVAGSVPLTSHSTNFYFLYAYQARRINRWLERTG